MYNNAYNYWASPFITITTLQAPFHCKVGMSSVPYDCFEITITNPTGSNFHVRCEAGGVWGALTMSVVQREGVLPLYTEYVFGPWLRWWNYVRDSALMGTIPMGSPPEQWIRTCDAIVHQSGEYNVRGSIHPDTTLTLVVRHHDHLQCSMGMGDGTSLRIERTDSPIQVSFCAKDEGGKLMLQLDQNATLPSGVNIITLY